MSVPSNTQYPELLSASLWLLPSKVLFPLLRVSMPTFFHFFPSLTSKLLWNPPADSSEKRETRAAYCNSLIFLLWYIKASAILLNISFLSGKHFCLQSKINFSACVPGLLWWVFCLPRTPFSHCPCNGTQLQSCLLYRRCRLFFWAPLYTQEPQRNANPWQLFHLP